MSSRNMWLFGLTVLMTIGLGWILLSPTIIPPAEVAAPVTVYVMNQDYHSRLVLPQDESWVQYAYGDWQYFALYQQSVRTALQALLVPTQGAIGRRTYDNIRDLQQATEFYNGSLVSFIADNQNVAQLVEQLNSRFNQNIETVIVNPLNRMSFVQDERDYTLLHNSNHEVAEWLEALGCQVEGIVLWSGFQVQEPPN
ncbi:DUF2459 domain-containing protein [Egbenema bharatensis]|uniref:DUF2459 domain-containing protein n=1 Tax=Egbenema bharatensis TaxID=3463334 RepID=UPI003A88C9A5